MATVSIGHRPTYYPDTAATLVEVHLLDFDADIYGCRVAVELTAFLRGQVRCANEQELVASSLRTYAFDVAWLQRIRSRLFGLGWDRSPYEQSNSTHGGQSSKPDGSGGRRGAAKHGN